MPLKTGKGSKVISANIKELMDSWMASGMMGTSKPKNAKKAQAQAAAIAYSKARKGK